MDRPVHKLQVCKSVLSVFAPHIWQKQMHIKAQKFSHCHDNYINPKNNMNLLGICKVQIHTIQFNSSNLSLKLPGISLFLSSSVR